MCEQRCREKWKNDGQFHIADVARRGTPRKHSSVPGKELCAIGIPREDGEGWENPQRARTSYEYVTAPVLRSAFSAESG